MTKAAVVSTENEEKIGKTKATKEDFFASFDAKVASVTDQTEKIIQQMKQ